MCEVSLKCLQICRPTFNDDGDENYDNYSNFGASFDESRLQIMASGISSCWAAYFIALAREF